MHITALWTIRLNFQPLQFCNIKNMIYMRLHTVIYCVIYVGCIEFRHCMA